MPNINIEKIKNIDRGVNTVKYACSTAKDISIHPKFSASLTVKSEASDQKHFDKGVKLDKEFTLWNIICFVLGVIAAFIAASVIVNKLFSLCAAGKKCKCSKESKVCKAEEHEIPDAD